MFPALNQALAARVERAARRGHMPPRELHALALDIKGDERVADLRASVAGRPDEELTSLIELKRRYLALRYDEWLSQIEG